MSDHVIIRGDMREALAEMDPNSVDAIARARIAHALETRSKSDDGPQGSLFDP